MPEPDCECSTAGFCPRYGIAQTQHHVHLCRTRPEYREKWAARRDGRLPLTDSVVPTPAPTSEGDTGAVQPPPAPVRRTPLSGTRTPPPPDAGVGTEMRELLRLMGLTPTSGCDCEERVRRMNAKGIDGCLADRAEIEGWLRAEAKTVTWAKKLKALIVGAVHGVTLNPANPEASLLDEAVRRARAKEGAK